MQLKRAALILGWITCSSSIAFADGDKEKDAKAADGKEAAKEPEKKLPPKPARRTWTVKKDKHAFTFEFKPGIPAANKVTEIMVNVAKVPDRPHPRFGNAIPVKGARLIIEVVNPAGESVGRYKTHAVKFSAGKYGFHVTPTQEGIYELIATLEQKGEEDMKARLQMPVDVWPLPDNLKGSGDASAGRGSRRPVVRKR